MQYHTIHASHRIASHRIASHRIAYMATSVEFIPSSSDTTATNDATSTSHNTETAAIKKYRTYTIKSWYEYQRFAASHLHSIEHYNETCKEDAKLSDEDVMVLRDNVTKITGYY